MKFIYPAVFRKTDRGTYKGFFPDLAECYGEGETLDEAIEEANEAAYNWISLELDEDDCQLPPVSDEDDLDKRNWCLLFAGICFIHLPETSDRCNCCFRYCRNCSYWCT